MKIGKRVEPKRRFAWVLPFFWGTQNHVQGRPYETSCFFMAWTVGRIIQYMESRGAMAPRPLFQVPWTWGKFCLLLVCSVTAEGKWSASGYAGYGCSWLEAMMMSFLALLRLTHTHTFTAKSRRVLISWNRNAQKPFHLFSVLSTACRLLLGPWGFVADGWFAPKRKVQDPESVPGARDEDGRGWRIHLRISTIWINMI